MDEFVTKQEFIEMGIQQTAVNRALEELLAAHGVNMAPMNKLKAKHIGEVDQMLEHMRHKRRFELKESK